MIFNLVVIIEGVSLRQYIHFRFTCEGRAVWFSNFTSWRLNPVHARLKRHFSVLSLENFMGSTRYLYFQSLVP